MNPIVFVTAVALVIAGAAKRWLNAHELVLCAGLAGIGYVTMGYDNVSSCPNCESWCCVNLADRLLVGDGC
jgi:hypothetical protein